MEQDKLDKFIKKQVEQHQTTTDPDLLWQKIQAKQNEEKKRKRRFLIFWFTGGGLLLFSLAFLLIPYFSGNDIIEKESSLAINENSPSINASAENKSETESETTKINEIEQEANLNQNTVSSLKSVDDEKVSNNVLTDNAEGELIDAGSMVSAKDMFDKKSGLNSAGQLNEKNSSIPLENGAISLSKSENDKIENDEPFDFSATGQKVDSRSDIEIADDVIVKDEEGELIGNTVQDLAKKNVDNPQADEENESVVVLKNEEEGIIGNSGLDLSEKNTDNSQSDEESEPAMVLENDLAKEKLAADSDIVEQSEDEKKSLGDDVKSEEKQWTFSNGAAFTYGQGLRTLSSRASAPADYLQTRNDTETPLDAVRVNLDFMAQHHSGFYLKAGLEYEQINERFNLYTERDSTEIFPNQVLAINYAMDGTTSETIGNGEVVRTHWLNVKRYNHYRSFDLPLLVGYNSKKKGNPLGWFIEGGAAMNLRFNASGEITDTTGQPLDLEENTDLFKSRTGVSLLGAAGLTYKVANKFSIWASPAIRYKLSSVTSDENTLDQKYMNVGLQMGIRYHWLKK